MKTRTFSSEVSIFTKLREGNVLSCVYSQGREVSLRRVPDMPPMCRVQASVPSPDVEPQLWSPWDMFILVQFRPHRTEPPPDRFKLVHHEAPTVDERAVRGWSAFLLKLKATQTIFCKEIWIYFGSWIAFSILTILWQWLENLKFHSIWWRNLSSLYFTLQICLCTLGLLAAKWYISWVHFVRSMNILEKSFCRFSST